MLTDGKGSWQHTGLWGSALWAKAQQRCLCLKPGMVQNAGRKQDKHSGTHCLSEEWQDNQASSQARLLHLPYLWQHCPCSLGGDVLAARCAAALGLTLLADPTGGEAIFVLLLTCSEGTTKEQPMENNFVL